VEPDPGARDTLSGLAERHASRSRPGRWGGAGGCRGARPSGVGKEGLHDGRVLHNRDDLQAAATARQARTSRAKTRCINAAQVHAPRGRVSAVGAVASGSESNRDAPE
jgi:hypothetical protein